VDREKVYLAQSDTTVGFLSSDDKNLSRIKQRSTKQKTLQVVDSFKTLKQNTRIPNRFKNKIRRSKKTTFIYPNGDSYRVVFSDNQHHNFIKKVKKMYSTSANITKQNFEEEFAKDNSDIDVVCQKNYFEGKPSTIIKLHKIQSIKIR
jgi:tRNA A37 threonylcarbamoyladenosine synthetase subunit TsaC/SUA5/YrdC